MQLHHPRHSELSRSDLVHVAAAYDRFKMKVLTDIRLRWHEVYSLLSIVLTTHCPLRVLLGRSRELLSGCFRPRRLDFRVLTDLGFGQIILLGAILHGFQATATS